MMRKINRLIVKYNGLIVGYLVQIDEERIAFQYDEKWLNEGFSISPFSLPLSNKLYINSKDTFNGLYGVFFDSLPDGWGELVTRRRLFKRGINYDRLSSLQKLYLVSGRGLGGLSYEPCEDLEILSSEFNSDDFAKEVEKILSNDENIDLDKVYRLGGSSGGARPKAHIIFNNEEWIIKFSSRVDPKDMGKEEFMANSIAKKCSINVTEFKLFDSKLCSGYFGTKRFDRTGIRKVHMISLSSLLETSHRIPNLDYYHLFQVIQNICIDKQELYEAFKRMCFNVFYKNRDDHGKNFSFLYDESIRSYKLSPAYDLTSTPNKIEHEMSINNKGNPTEKDILDLAIQFKLSNEKCKEILEDIKYNISKDKNE